MSGGPAQDDAWGIPGVPMPAAPVGAPAGHLPAFSGFDQEPEETEDRQESAGTLPPPTGEPLIGMPPTANETPTRTIPAVRAHDPAEVAPFARSAPGPGAPAGEAPAWSAPYAPQAPAPANARPMAAAEETPPPQAPFTAPAAFTPTAQPAAPTQQVAMAFQAPPGPRQPDGPPVGHPAVPPTGRPTLQEPVPAPPKRRRAALISTLAVVAVIGVAAAVIAVNRGGSHQPSTSVAGQGGESGRPGTADSTGAADVPGAPGANGSPGDSSASSPSPGAKSSTSGAASATSPKSSTPAGPSLAASTALHWRLADGGGTTAADAGPRGLAGRLAGPVVFSSAHGGSAVFTPTPGQVEGGAITASGVLDTTKSFTVSEWVYQTTPTTPTTYVSAFSQDASGYSAFYFTYSTAKKTWFFGRSLSDSANGGTDESWAWSTTPLNTWVLLTGVYDAKAGTVLLYVNGAAQTLIHTHSAPYAAHGPFAVGRSWYGAYPSNPFAGSISDVRVYNRVLTAAEVKSLVSAH